MRILEEALTFDDVLLIPAHSTVLPNEVDLKTSLTKKITLNIPLLSAAMDTVTEAKLAIAIAQEGGLGIVHKNMTIEAQAKVISAVKRFENGIIKDPVTTSADTSIAEVMALTAKHKISGLITVKDIQQSTDFPSACKDRHGSLRVGAAVGTGHNTEQRVAALVKAGVDVIIVDTAHGHSQGVLNRIKWVKDTYPDLQVIGGNIATGAAALALVEAGADAVKVGIGPGSICTTRMIAGVGVPQITAIMNVADALKGKGIPLIADGGIRYSGDIAKALAAGANCVMLGSMFAGTDEAPGDTIIYQGRSYKSYRGMGSLAAMADGSSDRYFQESENAADKLVPEGIEGQVPYKGKLGPIIHQLNGGIRSSMGYVGCKDIEEMRSKPEFVRITGAGMKESHVHDVTITKEAPNYHS
ncbi:UNVERIFIED_CONTAM: hypothetical protein GTU68_049966 [Idotea baltica]|nr:hypothetical protein [Idotea baltica]